MRLNWLSYQQRETDGYGRFCNRMIQALDRAGCEVYPWLSETANMPPWMWERLGVDWSALTISCLPPIYLHPVPGRHWLYSMTEGSILPTKPDDWADIINRSGVERVIVPCEHNRRAFVESGVKAPVYVIPGGTDPDEFPVLQVRRRDPHYTFLALGDRGQRKGWAEVWQAFYKTFGSPEQTPNVRLIIKCRPHVNDLLDMISKAKNPDPRVTIWQEDVADMRQVYASADCFVIPSRSEGWGMPMRECACMGIPVITQKYSGMDDGHTMDWATFVCLWGKLEPIPSNFEHIAGQWMRADVDELAMFMNLCYRGPQTVADVAQDKARWLREHQTFDHTAGRLLNMIREAS